MKKSQCQYDVEFAVWLSDLLGQRLVLLPRGQKPEEYAILGSGTPFYCYYDGEPMHQWEALHMAWDDIIKAVASPQQIGIPEEGFFRAMAKIGNVESCKVMASYIRAHRKVQ